MNLPIVLICVKELFWFVGKGYVQVSTGAYKGQKKKPGALMLQVLTVKSPDIKTGIWTWIRCKNREYS